jgi:ABC-type branched-subunit amino acid transport system substrate-binding protein
MDAAQLGSFALPVLLDAFRTHYHRFQTAVTTLVGSQADAIVVSRLGDDLDEFAEIVREVSC